MNPECAKALGAKKQRCWDVGVVSQYVKTPMLVAQNALDSNQLNDELLCPKGICNDKPTKPVAHRFFQDYFAKNQASMVSYLASHPNSAVFMPSCFSHTSDL